MSWALRPRLPPLRGSTEERETGEPEMALRPRKNCREHSQFPNLIVAKAHRGVLARFRRLTQGRTPACQEHHCARGFHAGRPFGARAGASVIRQPHVVFPNRKQRGATGPRADLAGGNGKTIFRLALESMTDGRPMRPGLGQTIAITGICIDHPRVARESSGMGAIAPFSE